MNKQEAMKFLVGCGILIKDGKIAKADVAKAVMLINTANAKYGVFSNDLKEAVIQVICDKVSDRFDDIDQGEDDTMAQAKRNLKDSIETVLEEMLISSSMTPKHLKQLKVELFNNLEHLLHV